MLAINTDHHPAVRHHHFSIPAVEPCPVNSQITRWGPYGWQATITYSDGMSFTQRAQDLTTLNAWLTKMEAAA